MGSDAGLGSRGPCTLVPVAEDRLAEANRLALSAHPGNLSGLLDAAGPPLPPQEMALMVARRWKPGQRLRVRFLDGDPSVHARVARVARTWSEHANVSFDFGDHPEAELRVSFLRPGTWSLLGTDALTERDPRVPTMNFRWLFHDTEDEEYERVVLHEFGHALGCVHEHQHPEGGIRWDVDAVVEYYRRELGWSREKVEANVLRPVSREAAAASSRVDPESIMMYPVPAELTLDGFHTGWNRALSTGDRAFIRRMYPFPDDGFEPLAVGGDPRPARLEAGGEGRFRLVVHKKGRYTVRTTGELDTVVHLHASPELDAASLLAWNDDGRGAAFNARVEKVLEPGTYYVRVSSFDAGASGPYAVAVTARKP